MSTSRGRKVSHKSSVKQEDEGGGSPRASERRQRQAHHPPNPGQSDGSQSRTRRSRSARLPQGAGDACNASSTDTDKEIIRIKNRLLARSRGINLQLAELEKLQALRGTTTTRFQDQHEDDDEDSVLEVIEVESSEEVLEISSNGDRKNLPTALSCCEEKPKRDLKENQVRDIVDVGTDSSCSLLETRDLQANVHRRTSRQATMVGSLAVSSSATPEQRGEWERDPAIVIGSSESEGHVKRTRVSRTQARVLAGRHNLTPSQETAQEEIVPAGHSNNSSACRDGTERAPGVVGYEDRAEDTTELVKNEGATGKKRGSSEEQRTEALVNTLVDRVTRTRGKASTDEITNTKGEESSTSGLTDNKSTKQQTVLRRGKRKLSDTPSNTVIIIDSTEEKGSGEPKSEEQESMRRNRRKLSDRLSNTGDIIKLDKERVDRESQSEHTLGQSQQVASAASVEEKATFGTSEETAGTTERSQDTSKRRSPNRQKMMAGKAGVPEEHIVSGSRSDGWVDTRTRNKSQSKDGARSDDTLERSAEKVGKSWDELRAPQIPKDRRVSEKDVDCNTVNKTDIQRRNQRTLGKTQDSTSTKECVTNKEGPSGTEDASDKIIRDNNVQEEQEGLKLTRRPKRNCKSDGELGSTRKIEIERLVNDTQKSEGRGARRKLRTIEEQCSETSDDLQTGDQASVEVGRKSRRKRAWLEDKGNEGDVESELDTSITERPRRKRKVTNCSKQIEASYDTASTSLLSTEEEETLETIPSRRKRAKQSGAAGVDADGLTPSEKKFVTEQDGGEMITERLRRQSKTARNEDQQNVCDGDMRKVIAQEAISTHTEEPTVASTKEDGDKGIPHGYPQQSKTATTFNQEVDDYHEVESIVNSSQEMAGIVTGYENVASASEHGGDEAISSMSRRQRNADQVDCSHSKIGEGSKGNTACDSSLEEGSLATVNEQDVDSDLRPGRQGIIIVPSDQCREMDCGCQNATSDKEIGSGTVEERSLALVGEHGVDETVFKQPQGQATYGTPFDHKESDTEGEKLTSSDITVGTIMEDTISACASEQDIDETVDDTVPKRMSTTHSDQQKESDSGQQKVISGEETVGNIVKEKNVPLASEQEKDETAPKIARREGRSATRPDQQGESDSGSQMATSGEETGGNTVEEKGLPLTSEQEQEEAMPKRPSRQGRSATTFDEHGESDSGLHMVLSGKEIGGNTVQERNLLLTSEQEKDETVSKMPRNEQRSSTNSDQQGDSDSGLHMVLIGEETGGNIVKGKSLPFGSEQEIDETAPKRQRRQGRSATNSDQCDKSDSGSQRVVSGEETSGNTMQGKYEEEVQAVHTRPKRRRSATNYDQQDESDKETGSDSIKEKSQTLTSEQEEDVRVPKMPRRLGRSAKHLNRQEKSDSDKKVTSDRESCGNAVIPERPRRQRNIVKISDQQEMYLAERDGLKGKIDGKSKEATSSDNIGDSEMKKKSLAATSDKGGGANASKRTRRQRKMVIFSDQQEDDISGVEKSQDEESKTAASGKEADGSVKEETSLASSSDKGGGERTSQRPRRQRKAVIYSDSETLDETEKSTSHRGVGAATVDKKNLAPLSEQDGEDTVMKRPRRRRKPVKYSDFELQVGSDDAVRGDTRSSTSEHNGDGIMRRTRRRRKPLKYSDQQEEVCYEEEIASSNQDSGAKKDKDPNFVCAPGRTRRKWKPSSKQGNSDEDGAKQTSRKQRRESSKCQKRCVDNRVDLSSRKVKSRTPKKETDIESLSEKDRENFKDVIKVADKALRTDGFFTCQSCHDRRPQSLRTLIFHLKYQCPSYNYIPQVMREEFDCTLCERKCRKLSTLATHIKVAHSLESTGECTSDEEFMKRKGFHKRQKKFKGRVRCPREDCLKSFTTLPGLQYHMARCGKEIDFLYECEHCQRKYKSQPGLSNHIETYHRNQPPEPEVAVAEENQLEGDTTMRKKRNAASKAIQKLHEIVETGGISEGTDGEKEVNIMDDMAYSKHVQALYKAPEDFKPDKSLSDAWKLELSDTRHATCPFCKRADIVSYNHVRSHSIRCKQRPGANDPFVCLTCQQERNTKKQILKHLLKEHKLLVDEALEKESEPEVVPEDEADEFNDKDDSVEEEDIDVSDEEMSEKRVIKRTRKRHPEAVKMKDYQTFDEYRSRCKPVTWTRKFRQELYCPIRETLFDSWQVDTEKWKELSKSNAEKYHPRCKRSAVFMVKRWQLHKCPHMKIDCQTLPLYGSVEDDENPIFFAGGPVRAMAWCPVPEEVTGREYAAVSCYGDMNHTQFVSDVTPSASLIQIWSLGITKNRMTSAPKMVLGLVHDYGVTNNLVWCPSGGYHSHIEKGYSRLGLLAVACSTGVVVIYPVPHAGADCPLLIYKPHPSVILRLNRSRGTWTGPCFSVDWSQNKGHAKIAAGFGNGTVGIWDLSTTSSLLKSEKDGIDYLYPTQVLLIGSVTVMSVSMNPVYDHYLAVAGADRYVSVWDTRFPDAPLNEINQVSGLDSHWPLYYQVALVSTEKMTYTARGCSVVGIDSGHFRFPARGLPLQSTIATFSISDWLHCFAGGSYDGQVAVNFCNVNDAEFRQLIPEKARILTDIAVVDRPPEFAEQEPSATAVETEQPALCKTVGDIVELPVETRPTERNLVSDTVNDRGDEQSAIEGKAEFAEKEQVPSSAARETDHPLGKDLEEEEKELELREDNREVLTLRTDKSLNTARLKTTDDNDGADSLIRNSGGGSASRDISIRPSGDSAQFVTDKAPGGSTVHFDPTGSVGAGVDECDSAASTRLNFGVVKATEADSSQNVQKSCDNDKVGHCLFLKDKSCIESVNQSIERRILNFGGSLDDGTQEGSGGVVLSKFKMDSLRTGERIHTNSVDGIESVNLEEIIGHVVSMDIMEGAASSIDHGGGIDKEPENSSYKKVDDGERIFASDMEDSQCNVISNQNGAAVVKSPDVNGSESQKVMDRISTNGFTRVNGRLEILEGSGGVGESRQSTSSVLDGPDGLDGSNDLPEENGPSTTGGVDAQIDKLMKACQSTLETLEEEVDPGTEGSPQAGLETSPGSASVPAIKGAKEVRVKKPCIMDADFDIRQVLKDTPIEREVRETETDMDVGECQSQVARWRSSFQSAALGKCVAYTDCHEENVRSVSWRTSTKRFLKKTSLAKPSLEYPLNAVTKVVWSPNFQSRRWLLVAGQNGLVRMFDVKCFSK